MSNEPLACPYCNALVPAPAEATVGQRIPCPRCGETFTLLRSAASATDAQPAPADAQPDAQGLPHPGRSNRVVAGAVLGAMAVMAVVGLAYALYTTGVRRAHDTAMPPPPRKSPLAELPPEPPAAPPASLEALRWLPPETTLVAGVQVAELRQTAAGREMMRRLFQVGKMKIDADLLERWTGLKVDQVDHIVLGVRAQDDAPPPAVLVVRMIRPYDADAVKAALGAVQVPDEGGKTLYKCKPREGGLRPVLWFADPRTLVFGLLTKHLAAIPDRPAAGPERLAPQVRDCLETWLSPGEPAWAVGYSADWRQTGAALLLGGLAEKDADLLGHIRSCAIKLEAAQPPKLLAVVQCDGDEAAQALEARLTAAKPAAADWKTARSGLEVSLQVRGDPATLLDDLRK